MSKTIEEILTPKPVARPRIYAYSIDDKAHKGLLKVGQTTRNVKQRVADYRKANKLADTQLVPADAVTASASGLDPHISVKNALLQLPRVAKARGLSVDDLKKLMDQYTDGPDFGILGDAGVNIVKLNLALDGLYK